MPKISGKMNDHERGICSRVKELREAIGWTQSAFARQIGITREALASIEYKRTPLRYDVAWRIRAAFSISLSWLEEDFPSPEDWEDDRLPPPTDTGLSPLALLSEVALKFSSVDNPGVSVTRYNMDKPAGEAHELFHRYLYEKLLKTAVEEWIYRLPNGYIVDFHRLLSEAGERLMKGAPRDPDTLVNERAEAMMWERIRIANASKMISTKLGKKKPLTDVSVSVKQSAMKSPMADLLARLNLATAQRGKKSELAAYFKLPLASISQWLSGDREPGGETTLRLLQWVVAEEAKQKSPGSALTPPERKAQLSQSSYEKTKSGRKKD